MKRSILLTSVLLSLLVSCMGPNKKWEESRTTEEYRVTGIDGPKHFYLDLARVSDGETFDHVYISKHCNDMCIEVGSIIKATRVKYKYEGRKWEEFDNYAIQEDVCNCR